MDTIKRKSALTLIELLIAMILGIILTLVISYQFVAMVRFSNALKNKAEPSREAYVVMAHMTNVLRFASASSMPATPFAKDNGTKHYDELTFTIVEAGHAVSPDTYYYRRDTGTNYLNFSTTSGGGGVQLSQCCTRFSAVWDSANSLLTIGLDFATENGPTITDTTTIRVLGQ